MINFIDLCTQALDSSSDCAWLLYLYHDSTTRHASHSKRYPNPILQYQRFCRTDTGYHRRYHYVFLWLAMATDTRQKSQCRRWRLWSIIISLVVACTVLIVLIAVIAIIILGTMFGSFWSYRSPCLSAPHSTVVLFSIDDNHKYHPLSLRLVGFLCQSDAGFL